MFFGKNKQLELRIQELEAENRELKQHVCDEDLLLKEINNSLKQVEKGLSFCKTALKPIKNFTQNESLYFI